MPLILSNGSGAPFCHGWWSWEWEPLRKKCRPVLSAARDGVQEGTETKAFRNSAPSRATRSKAGVVMMSLGDGLRRIGVGRGVAAEVVGEEQQDVGLVGGADADDCG